jgi:hypothetical protein
MIKAARSSETSLSLYQSTWGPIPEHRTAIFETLPLSSSELLFHETWTCFETTIRSQKYVVQYPTSKNMFLKTVLLYHKNRNIDKLG